MWTEDELKTKKKLEKDSSQGLTFPWLRWMADDHGMIMGSLLPITHHQEMTKNIIPLSCERERDTHRLLFRSGLRIKMDCVFVIKLQAMARRRRRKKLLKNTFRMLNGMNGAF